MRLEEFADIRPFFVGIMWDVLRAIDMELTPHRDK